MDTNTMQQIVEFYKTLLQQENSNHTIFITVLLGMFVILLGATWWWNKSGASKKIVTEINRKFEKEREKLIKEFSIILSSSIDEKVKKYENKILMIEADVARSMANSAFISKIYTHSIFWLGKNLDLCMKLKNDYNIRFALDLLTLDIESLKEEEEKQKLSLKEGEKYENSKIHECQYVIDIVSKLPETLYVEKRKILTELKNRMDNKKEEE